MATSGNVNRGSLEGKVCLVTGANSGIGKATALGLAKLGARVVMVCRDGKKGETAQSEIVAQSKNKGVDLLVADLAAQASVRQLAQDFKAKYSHLHVLINNAGLHKDQRTLTPDGLETTFAVNHLATFMLTLLLLDMLKASAPARVVNLASSMHNSSLDFGNLQGEKRYEGLEAYSASKLCTILFTYELARRLEGSGVTVNCVHPGTIRSGLQRELPASFQAMRLFMGTPEKGAESPIYLAASPKVEGVSGKYFSEKEIAAPAEIANDRAVAQRLWQVSAELTGMDGA